MHDFRISSFPFSCPAQAAPSRVDGEINTKGRSTGVAGSL